MAGKHRIRETSDKVGGLLRQLDAYGTTIGSDPAALVHLRELEQRLTEAVNRGIYLANRGKHRYSLAEIARIMNISRPGVLKRVNHGEQAYAAWLARQAAGQPVASLPAVRRARAEGLRAAEVVDLFGSERERRAAGE